ncbi:MAG: site-2 protease family protein [Thermoplasmata archaeon]
MYRTSYPNENKDILVSVLALTAAFAIAFRFSSPYGTGFVIAVAFLVSITAFLFHELAHRYVARSYGGVAYFKMWPLGILLALVTSVFGFIFAAPGAVNFSGVYRKDQVGKTALAGPATNVGVGLILYVSGMMIPVGIVSAVLIYTATMNFWFGFFNLLPIPPLDGYKVLSWDIYAFLVAIIIALIFVALTVRF